MHLADRAVTALAVDTSIARQVIGEGGNTVIVSRLDLDLLAALENPSIATEAPCLETKYERLALVIVRTITVK